MKQNKYEIEYKNGTKRIMCAYSMELENDKLYQCVKSLAGDQGYPSVIDGSFIKKVVCIEKNNDL